MRFASPLRASALADLLGPDLLSEPLPASCFGLRLLSLDAPHKAMPGSLACIGPHLPRKTLAGLRASLVLAEAGAGEGLPPGFPVVRVTSSYGALARLLHGLKDAWVRSQPFEAGEGNSPHASAVIEGVLEGDVDVGALAYIAPTAYIGRGSRIEAGARILDHVILGRNCVVQSGAIIGGQGFGFYPGPGGGKEAMPHPAGVILGDDVFIGALTVVASGVLHPTLVGNGCKLDSHVQIAHNVELGENSILASQSGIAGSTVIGPGLRMGGAASISGHLHLGGQVTIAACSAVTKDLPDGAIVAGFPARPIQKWRRESAALRRLGSRNPD